MTTITAPETSPFGVGEAFEIVVPTDVLSHHGNVIVSAGTYQAWQSDFDDTSISLWSPNYYGGATGGGWVSLPAWHFHLPGEEPTPIPEHDCFDQARSGVVSGIYCGICMRDLT